MVAKIGILGGIGPEATAEFYKRIIFEIQKHKLVKKNTDYPQIIINSIPGEELFLENVDFEPYLKGLEELDRFGVDFIVIVCNTAYKFFDKFQKAIRTSILDLRKAVKESLINKKVNSVTILGSNITIKSNLFDLDIKQNNPTEEEINFLDGLIKNYSSQGEKRNLKKFEDIIKKYSKKSEVILSACTEISLLMKESKVSFIDTMDILVEEVLKKLGFKSGDELKADVKGKKLVIGKE